jgi:hypothetical protein
LFRVGRAKPLGLMVVDLAEEEESALARFPFFGSSPNERR